MRKIIILLLFTIPTLLMAQQSEVLQLNEGWQFSQVADTNQNKENVSW
jgi:beta-mannosidase